MNVLSTTKPTSWIYDPAYYLGGNGKSFLSEIVPYTKVQFAANTIKQLKRRSFHTFIRSHRTPYKEDTGNADTIEMRNMIDSLFETKSDAYLVSGYSSL